MIYYKGDRVRRVTATPNPRTKKGREYIVQGYCEPGIESGLLRLKELGGEWVYGGFFSKHFELVEGATNEQ